MSDSRREVEGLPAGLQVKYDLLSIFFFFLLTHDPYSHL